MESKGSSASYPTTCPWSPRSQSESSSTRRTGQWELIAVGGGFIQVLPSQVTVVADVAERSEEIDRDRAEAARRSAEQALSESAATETQAEAEAQLQRAAAAATEVAQRRRCAQGRTTTPPSAGRNSRLDG